MGYLIFFFYLFLNTFSLLYFCLTKSTKSHQRELSSLFEISPPVSATPTNALRALVHSPRARVSRASHAWQVRAAKGKMKVGGFVALHGFSHTTRANISREIAEQIRARIVCTPAESAWRGLTHMRSMCVGVAETGRGWSLRTDGIENLTVIDTSSVSLRLPPSPTGEGLSFLFAYIILCCVVR